jgi:CheY-like chemotaxis protein
MSELNQHSKRVLVADDDPIIRRLITAAVQREGFETVVANDGREAYRILQSDANFRAAIFDMMMPHLQGLDVIRFMRTEKRLMRIPVMMMTSEKNLKLMAGVFPPAPHSFCASRLRRNNFSQRCAFSLAPATRRKRQRSLLFGVFKE